MANKHHSDDKFSTTNEKEPRIQGSADQQVIQRSNSYSKARDQVTGAYAGNENRGPKASEKAGSQHSTNVKGRVTEKSKTRTPER